MASVATSEGLWPEAAQPAADLATVQEAVGAAGTSFYWAMRVLPADRRGAMYAVYAFCRAVDDVADGDAAPDEKEAALRDWRAAIAQLYAGRPDRPLTRLIAPNLDRIALRQADFEAVIDGMAMDAAGPIRAPDGATLALYCDRVACAVGRLCIGIFGEPTTAGRLVADHLGLALQLTNILRDLDEDAELGRLYLPRELLERHGIDTDLSIDAVLASERIDAVCRTLAEDALSAFARADQAMQQCDARAMRPARMMRGVYGLTLERLIARGWATPRRPVRPSKLRKLWCALRYGWLTPTVRG